MTQTEEAPSQEVDGRSQESIGTAGHIVALPQQVTNGAVTPESDRGTAIQHALLSAFIPGAAQFAQGRWVAGLAQCGVVVAYLAGVFAVGRGEAVWLAILWNAYSAVEAYWYERR